MAQQLSESVSTCQSIQPSQTLVYGSIPDVDGLVFAPLEEAGPPQRRGVPR
jgi:hypothetical protein